jgi:hypothetical protein
VRVALDTNVLAYAEGINGAERRDGKARPKGGPDYIRIFFQHSLDTIFRRAAKCLSWRSLRE